MNLAEGRSETDRVAGIVSKGLWRVLACADNLTFEDATELALDKSLWRLLVASGATHWHGACRIMMMMMTGC